MSVRSNMRRFAVASVVIISACSDRDAPDSGDWVIGVYSTLEPSSLSSDRLKQFHFDQDSVRIVKVDLSGPETEATLPWETRDERTVAIVELGGYSDDKEILVFKSEGCEPLTYRSVPQSGFERTPSPLYRGEVCVRQGDPDTIGGSYETYWCDEPPEPCEESS